MGCGGAELPLPGIVAFLMQKTYPALQGPSPLPEPATPPVQAKSTVPVMSAIHENGLMDPLSWVFCGTTLLSYEDCHRGRRLTPAQSKANTISCSLLGY